MADCGIILRTKLASESSVTDLVGDRIRPDALVQNDTLPAIAYVESTSIHEHGLAGVEGTVTGTVEVGCFDSKRIGANNLAEKVRLALDCFRGSVGSDYVKSILLTDRTKEYDIPVDGSDAGRYVVTLDFDMVTSETIPS